jgi:hypothetical protein
MMEMPSFSIIARSLRDTTERLAREVVDPLDSPPNWSEFEWAVARAAAATQGLTALLANRLRWPGPPQWQSFMTEQREQSLLRHARIRELIRQIENAFRDAGIGGIALKGAVLRELDLYLPGERPMGDVDLLVRPDDLSTVAGALKCIDYTLAFTTQRHAVFEPRQKSICDNFAEHIDHPLKIEVHTAVAERLPESEVEITSVLWDQPESNGLVAYPGLRELMLHLLLHCAGNMRAHALRQIQCHDIALLGRQFNDNDWRGVVMEPGTRTNRWWVYPPLAITERYYKGCVPSDVLWDSRKACPRALRRAIDRKSLTDVSWSNLRICAFPGISWARTPVEALRYIRSRALPSRKRLDELSRGVQRKPGLLDIPWYGMSHAKRILRWLVMRPPRVQTMLSVQSALANVSGANER